MMRAAIRFDSFPPATALVSCDSIAFAFARVNALHTSLISFLAASQHTLLHRDSL
jgi:hypothetical protein